MRRWTRGASRRVITNLSEKFNNLKSKLGNLGENKLLLITSITLMDEYFETKKIEEKR